YYRCQVYSRQSILRDSYSGSPVRKGLFYNVILGLKFLLNTVLINNIQETTLNHKIQAQIQDIIMSNVLYSFFSIQQILTKMSVVFVQPLKKEPKQEWIYRGEGNANLVISLPDKRQILRIQKTDKPKTFLVWLLNWLSDFLYWDTKHELNVDSQDLKFYKLVMMPLLGQFVCEATPIFMSRKQTHDLNRAIAQCRPSK
ncbi:hypothetical protein AMK59_4775, partial [Oryctes borbonicus]